MRIPIYERQSYKQYWHPKALFYPKFVNAFQAFSRPAVFTSTAALRISEMIAQFRFPLGPFLKRPHFPTVNVCVAGGKVTCRLFLKLLEKWRAAISCRVASSFSCFKNKTRMWLGKRGGGEGTKSKTSVVSAGKWTSSTPSLGPQPRPVLPRAWQGRERGRVGPASPREPARRAASLRLRAAFANSALPGLPGADLLVLWGPEQRSRSFKILGRSGGLAGGHLVGAPGTAAGRGGHLPRGRGAQAAQLVRDAPWSAPLAAAPPPELSLSPGLGRKCRPFTSKICQKRKSWRWKLSNFAKRLSCRDSRQVGCPRIFPSVKRTKIGVV